jgi:DNA repair photolyase
VPSDRDFRWRLSDDDGGQPMLFDESDLVERHVGKGEYSGLEFLHVNAKRMINEVPRGSRMAFRYTINAYRGCSHACQYCFARPTHEYLGLDIGEDFERKLVVKINAVEKVRAELRSPQWRGDLIAMGTNTDPYQHAEGKYHLTRGVIGVLSDAGNPFSILTKSTLILRDLDLLVEASKRTAVRCNLSIGSLDEDVWKKTEPKTPPPRRRIEAVKRLNEAGIPTGVLIAPIIPGWSDDPATLEELAEACLEAGAVSVNAVALHLRQGTKAHFLNFVDRENPGLTPVLRKRYRGAYLPPKEQSRITSPVTRVLIRRAAASNVEVSDLTRWDPVPARDERPEPPVEGPASEQMRLV